MERPYIGVTGFTSRDSVELIERTLPEGHSHLLMVGVLANVKTLQGLSNTRFPARTPEVIDIDKIFTDNPRCLNLIHYNTNDQTTLKEQLIRLHILGGAHLHGFQLNMVWPDPKVIAWVHTHLGQKAPSSSQSRAKIVLQVGNGAMRKIAHDPRALAKRVGEYHHNIDYVLLDPSGGRGVPFDPVQARELLLALREAHGSWLGLGIAGGLGPDSLHLIDALITEFPDLSIDCEGQIRNIEDDSLNLERTTQYVRLSAERFRAARA